jgi:histidinol phosphatase-like PHP family hydrolase
LIETVFASYINICKNPLIDVIAHPFNLGRMKTEYCFKLKDLPHSLLREMARDMAKHKKAFEISSQLYYWYPNERVREVTEDYAKIIRLFVEEGVRCSVGTDAHSVGTIGNLHWALSVIRKAGLSKDGKDWFIDI